jgi:hypothetical protein
VGYSYAVHRPASTRASGVSCINFTGAAHCESMAWRGSAAHDLTIFPQGVGSTGLEHVSLQSIKEQKIAAAKPGPRRYGPHVSRPTREQAGRGAGNSTGRGRQGRMAANICHVPVLDFFRFRGSDFWPPPPPIDRFPNHRENTPRTAPPFPNEPAHAQSLSCSFCLPSLRPRLCRI